MSENEQKDTKQNFDVLTRSNFVSLKEVTTFPTIRVSQSDMGDSTIEKPLNKFNKKYSLETGPQTRISKFGEGLDNTLMISEYSIKEDNSAGNEPE